MMTKEGIIELFNSIINVNRVEFTSLSTEVQRIYIEQDELAINLLEKSHLLGLFYSKLISYKIESNEYIQLYIDNIKFYNKNITTFIKDFLKEIELLNPVLLKGTSLWEFYTNSYERRSSDVDIYIPIKSEVNIDIIKQTIINKYKIENDSYFTNHYMFDYNYDNPLVCKIEILYKLKHTNIKMLDKFYKTIGDDIFQRVVVNIESIIINSSSSSKLLLENISIVNKQEQLVLDKTGLILLLILSIENDIIFAETKKLIKFKIIKLYSDIIRILIQFTENDYDNLFLLFDKYSDLQPATIFSDILESINIISRIDNKSSLNDTKKSLSYLDRYYNIIYKKIGQ